MDVDKSTSRLYTEMDVDASRSRLDSMEVDFDSNSIRDDRYKTIDDDDSSRDRFKSCVSFFGGQQYPTIAQFYSGKTVAITGGTGFVGQGIIEKLLRCCPGIKKIILLIRMKRGVSPEERLNELCQLPVFDRLRQINPHFGAYLSCLHCDLAEKRLGLSHESKQIIKEEVEVFIHSAAGLRFNENLRTGYLLNTKCTQHIVRLCKKMPRLVAFVHVSTAFSNCDRPEFKERIYRWKVNYRDFESSLRWMSDDSIQKVTPDVLGGKPNTYVLTKAMAEEVIADECREIPTCIVRPGMIIAAWREPQPGWIGNAYGPTAFMAGYMKGLCRQVIAEPSMTADLVPIDFVVNCVIASAMKTAYDFTTRKEEERRTSSYVRDITVESDDSSEGNPVGEYDDEIPIYCMVTGAENPLKLKVLYDALVYWNSQHPASPIFPPSDNMYYSNTLYQIRTFFTQTILAYMLDFAQVLTLQPRRFVKINDRIMAGMEVMQFFFTHQFTFHVDNLIALRASLCESDRQEFTTDAKEINWFHYLRSYCLGVQKFILKEKPEDLPMARRKLVVLDGMLRCWKATLYLMFNILPGSIGAPSAVWDVSCYCWHMKRGKRRMLSHW